MRHVVAAFVVSRVAVVMEILLALTFLTPNFSYYPDASANPLLAGLARWDGALYLDIAEHGYEGPRASNAAFWPLYPLLMRLGGAALGGSRDAYLVAGIVISNAALLVAMRSLILLAAPRIGVGGARRAAMYVLVFPTTLVLSAVYAEALFLAFAVTSAVEAGRGRWWRSGVLAALAALTRPFGVLCAIPLAFALLRARRSVPAGAWLSAALAPVALLAWAGYLYRLSGDPLRLVHVQAAWEKRTQLPHEAFRDLLDPTVFPFPWFILALIALMTGLVAASWRVAGAAAGAYATACLVVITSAGWLGSSMRHELAIYPAFIVLGALTERRWAHILWTTASAMIASVFTAMFALWYWVS